MERNEIISNLLKNGATQVRNLKVKNVTVTLMENYTRLGITLDKPVKGMINNDGNWEEGETNVIFVSLYSITSLLKDNDDAAFCVNHLVAHPNAMSVMLSRATIDIIQEPVVAGQEYKNPWSTNAESTVFDHDTIITHVTHVTLSDFAIKQLDKIANSLLGL